MRIKSMKFVSSEGVQTIQAGTGGVTEMQLIEEGHEGFTVTLDGIDYVGTSVLYKGTAYCYVDMNGQKNVTEDWMQSDIHKDYSFVAGQATYIAGQVRK
jgi:hypothetical protein